LVTNKQRPNGWQDRYEASLADEERRHRAERDGPWWYLFACRFYGQVLIGVVMGIGALISTGNAWLVALSGVLSILLVLCAIGLVIVWTRGR
jgi:hypothetical protein